MIVPADLEEDMNMTFHKGLRVILLMTILLLNFGSANVQTVYAIVPSNDDIGNATLIEGLTYNDIVDTTEALDDDSFSNMTTNRGLCNDSKDAEGNIIYNYLSEGYKSLWYTYTPPEDQVIQADTFGSTQISNGIQLDTYIVVWKDIDPDPDVIQLAMDPNYCNDDTEGVTSRLTFIGYQGVDYYFEVAEWASYDYAGPPTGVSHPANMHFNVHITNVDVNIGTDLMGQYFVGSGESMVRYYPVDGGPVVIKNTTGGKAIASVNNLRKREGTPYWTGVAQSMALPVENISNIYVMPRYDYSNTSQLYNAILLANVDTVAREITVTIGGIERGKYTIGASGSQFVTYSGLAGGPIVVSSATGSKIVASLYELRRDPTLAGWNGQSEMMGLPWEQLSDKYLIPMYFGANNPKVLDARLFIGVP